MGNLIANQGRRSFFCGRRELKVAFPPCPPAPETRPTIGEPRGGGHPGSSRARVLRPREEGPACLAPQCRSEGAPGVAEETSEEGAVGSAVGEGLPLLRDGGPVLPLPPRCLAHPHAAGRGRFAVSRPGAHSSRVGRVGIALALDLVLYLKTQFNTRNKTRGFNLSFIPQVSNQAYKPGIIGY